MIQLEEEKRLVAYAADCKENYATAYFFGGIGDLLTEHIIAYKAAKFPSAFPEERLKMLRSLVGTGTYGFDCSGLIKHYFMGGFQHFVFNKAQDLDSDMMFRAAAEKGPIDTLPEIPGLILFLKGHVGIYAGAGKVIEATPRVSPVGGVVCSALAEVPWTHWLRCPLIPDCASEAER